MEDNSQVKVVLVTNSTVANMNGEGTFVQNEPNSARDEVNWNHTQIQTSKNEQRGFKNQSKLFGISNKTKKDQKGNQTSRGIVRGN